MKIVIVEDEAPIREGMGRILKKIDPGYEVAGMASNGKEGLDVIRKTRPDLVILDIQMPDMDGLTMLEIIRKEKITCKALVLSAYSEFTYARRAIELGIENYLLKPIKIPELKRALSQIRSSLEKEQSKESILTLDNIFMGCLTGQLTIDEQMGRLIEDKYELKLNDRLYLFLVWLGEGYESQKAQARQLLEEVGRHSSEFSMHLLEFPSRCKFVAVLYKPEDGEKLCSYFEKAVVPMLRGSLKRPVVCMWQEAEGLGMMETAIRQMRQDLEWNLVIEEGSLITPGRIRELGTAPMKYPLELETQARQAIIKRDEETFKKSYFEFKERCRQGRFHPKEIKEACLRYCFAVLNTAKEYGNLQEELSAQNMLQTISRAVTWYQIGDALRQFFVKVVITGEGEESLTVSAMVQRAQQMIQDYYNQGVTLEEIARKLHVSEEYLSTQFKKETGTTFSETIRKCRIEKVKELLVNSTLKLNQIADLAGYSDPKYMSKVFRDETGMLPAEYRKMNT